LCFWVKGDSLILKYKHENHWNRPTNKSFDVYSPVTGGKNLTFVDITVVQTTSIGHSHIIDGGIGENFIVIRVNGTNTTTMDFISQFYGIS
jgi:hypothetical protein